MALGVLVIYWVFHSGNKNATPSDSPSESGNVVMPSDDTEVCIQVVTSATNPDTGEVVDFPTPCDVPEGWEAVAPSA